MRQYRSAMAAGRRQPGDTAGHQLGRERDSRQRAQATERRQLTRRSQCSRESNTRRSSQMLVAMRDGQGVDQKARWRAEPARSGRRAEAGRTSQIGRPHADATRRSSCRLPRRDRDDDDRDEAVAESRRPRRRRKTRRRRDDDVITTKTRRR